MSSGGGLSNLNRHLPNSVQENGDTFRQSLCEKTKNWLQILTLPNERPTTPLPDLCTCSSWKCPGLRSPNIPSRRVLTLGAHSAAMSPIQASWIWAFQKPRDQPCPRCLVGEWSQLIFSRTELAISSTASGWLQECAASGRALPRTGACSTPQENCSLKCRPSEPHRFKFLERWPLRLHKGGS